MTRATTTHPVRHLHLLQPHCRLSTGHSFCCHPFLARLSAGAAPGGRPEEPGALAEEAPLQEERRTPELLRWEYFLLEIYFEYNEICSVFSLGHEIFIHMRFEEEEEEVGIASLSNDSWIKNSANNEMMFRSQVPKHATAGRARTTTSTVRKPRGSRAGGSTGRGAGSGVGRTANSTWTGNQQGERIVWVHRVEKKKTRSSIKNRLNSGTSIHLSFPTISYWDICNLGISWT